jgi:hypothetical protein
MNDTIVTHTIDDFSWLLVFSQVFIILKIIFRDSGCILYNQVIQSRFTICTRFNNDTE